MARISHIPNRSRQFDMRIRYRTLLSPPMTCPVGLRSNNAQDRLQAIAILFQRFSSRSNYLRKIHEMQNEYSERLCNMKRTNIWTVGRQEKPGTFLGVSDISCHVYLVVLKVQLLMNSSNEFD